MKTKHIELDKHTTVTANQIMYEDNFYPAGEPARRGSTLHYAYVVRVMDVAPSENGLDLTLDRIFIHADKAIKVRDAIRDAMIIDRNKWVDTIEAIDFADGEFLTPLDMGSNGKVKHANG